MVDRPPGRAARDRRPMPEPIVRDAAEAAGLESAPLLVLEPLRAFLDAAGLGSGRSRPPIGAGHSNVTFLLRRGADRIVLRRPPRGPLPPRPTTCCARRGCSARWRHGACRCPRCSRSARTPRVIGAPFYVMALHRGRVDQRRRCPRRSTGPGRRRQIAEQLVDALVELHAVDLAPSRTWRRFGRPTGYLERQLRRFGGLLEANATRRCRSWSGRRVARREPAGEPPHHGRPRRLPARQRHVRVPHRPGSPRCSTGRWRRSAIRSPTSAT